MNEIKDVGFPIGEFQANCSLEVRQVGRGPSQAHKPRACQRMWVRNHGMG